MKEKERTKWLREKDVVNLIDKRIEELEETNRRNKIVLNRKSISEMKRQVLTERMICIEASVQELKNLKMKLI